MDIRDRTHPTHRDVASLNFLRGDDRFFFRRHFRQGLRSHVIEVLDSGDVVREREGVDRDGVRIYPGARPLWILRIFRSRFPSREAALSEIERFRALQAHLTPNQYAFSQEFLADYRGPAGPDLLLCGFQAYVEGEILDPWSPSSRLERVPDLFPGRFGDGAGSRDALRRRVRDSARRFTGNVRAMVRETGLLPDLAGVGNLLLSPDGGIRLVDINNICRLAMGPKISLDDKGYPVCDRSLEALHRLETRLADRVPDPGDPLFRSCRDPHRRAEVARLEEEFYRRIGDGRSSCEG